MSDQIPRIPGRRARLLAWLILATLVAAVVFSWWRGGLVFELFRSDTESSAKIEYLRAFFADCGVWAPLVYFVFVTIEVVVAPIPGLMLYAPGGVIFGAFIGGALALAGNIAGAGIACAITRHIVSIRLDRFFDPSRIETSRNRLQQRGGWLIFLLRLNPLTSSDIVSYAAGFTRIPIRTVMIATGFGMAPLCFVQAWLAESVFTAFPQLVYPLLIACLAYVIVVIFVLRKLWSGDEPAPAEGSASSESV